MRYVLAITAFCAAVCVSAQISVAYAAERQGGGQEVEQLACRPYGSLVRPDDPVQHPDLDQAWKNYYSSVLAAAKDFRAAIEKKIEDASANGDLKGVEKWHAILQRFDTVGDLPKTNATSTTFSTLKSSLGVAKTDLTKAYRSIAVALTTEKKIAEAVLVKDELELVLASPYPVPRGAKVFKGHHYMFVTEAKSWHEAKTACEEMGGHLVTIANAAENDFAFGLTGGSDAWIGCSDEVIDGQWKWTTGEPFTYRNWAAGQPDNFHGDPFGIFWSERPGQLGDCADRTLGPIPFICEWEF